MPISAKTARRSVAAKGTHTPTTSCLSLREVQDTNWRTASASVRLAMHAKHYANNPHIPTFQPQTEGEEGPYNKREKQCTVCGQAFTPAPKSTAMRCPACRISRCTQCGRDFERPHRSDSSKDAGKFCCKGCYWVHRRRGGGGGSVPECL